MGIEFSRVIINLVLFQIGWFSIVLLGATELHVLASVVAVIIVSIHLYLSSKPLVEVKLILCALYIGLIWESVIYQWGLLVYSYGQLGSVIAPHWIILMWALFATTLNVSLRWMKGRWALSILFGTIGGPLAFYAGFKLNAVHIPDVPLAMIVLGVGWGVLTPCMVWCAQRYDGVKL
ncbi:MAG: hypothetical protein ACI9J2_001337 [Saprospiraceae bacterium]|jgi:hypothetical protein